MARRKSALVKMIEAHARARAAREREERRQRKLVQAAAVKAKREAEQARAVRERQRQVSAEKAARDEAARIVRARADATARQRHADKAAADAARTREAARRSAEQKAARARREEAAEQTRAARARASSERDQRRAAVEAKTAVATERSEALAADEQSRERILFDRARPAVGVVAAAEQRFNGEGPAGLANAVADTLNTSLYPDGLTVMVEAECRPELRELVIAIELPRQTVVASAAGYRYVRAREAIEPIPRKAAEVKALYGRLLARIVLRAVSEAFAAAPATLVNSITVNGYVSAKNPATGRPVRPCLISVGTSREEFDALDLDEPELDPGACLRQYLNAIVSPHPYDLEPVRPLVTFDLSRYKFVDELSVAAGLDSRPDLLSLKPVEFEHLVRELFEAMGMKSWVTQASRDEGVDAVVVNEDPILGGLCVIQAKRYSKIVGVESINALAGVMNDKNAAKGILVTTSWVGQASRNFAARNGRIQIIEGRELRYLLREHLGREVLISLEKPPQGWTAADLGDGPADSRSEPPPLGGA